MSYQENNLLPFEEEASKERGPDQVPEAEYLDEEDEIDPYIKTMKRLVALGDSKAVQKYVLSTEGERDMEEHIHIDMDRSMMPTLNNEDTKRGQAPTFGDEKIKQLLRLQHEARMDARAGQDQKKQNEQDQARLDEIRKSLGLPSGPNVKGTLGPGEQERSAD